MDLLCKYGISKKKGGLRGVLIPKYFMCRSYYKEVNSILKGKFAKYFIGLSDAAKYDTIWTENENFSYRFLPEILTFKECSNRVQNVLNTCWTRFEPFLNDNISGRE